MPSPPCSCGSALVSTSLTQPLARFMPGSIGRGAPWSPLRQGWKHHHRLISHPRFCHGNGASSPNPKLADRLTRRTRTQPKCHAWDPHQGEHSSWKRHCHDPKGQVRRCLEAAGVTQSNRHPSRLEATFSGTPLRSCVASPSSTPPAMRRPNFAWPQAAGR
jgi:hypothetical protein